MALFEFRAEIPAATAGTVDDILLEEGASSWSVVEDVIAGRAWLVGVNTEDSALAAEWRNFEPLLRDAGVTPVASPQQRSLGDADWRDSYKAHFHPWQFGPLHWVPVWQRETYAIPAGHAVLWLDPGLAFGTGNHETTRLCCERLVALAGEFGIGPNATSDRRRLRVIDAGCGSGILALSAARLGFGPVSGFDNDPEAVRVSRENAELNDLAGEVEFFVGDLQTGLDGRQAEVVLANILANVLMQHAEDLIRAVVPGGALVLSGILEQEAAAVRQRFGTITRGWMLDSQTLGEWTDVILRRPPN